ncbi:patatin-like phospholipase family protein [Aureisphaera galaxeae]|uniref:patatin-like phospholipase family protein n=1 Tax=Aureisphaera galaxeae TaxID=1538023 RepID=UPI0023505BC3|nr:patatin-like phospholipase family protein [Aureisphaera galaxeae]MDC8004342.1 patatin-like phospholipase family protein [Aureisphaera galaxeae]
MKKQSTKDPKLVPFDGIGLCFSGGGYRATFFALGVISYLHRIQYKNQSLLSKARAVSSVSGGTLLAVAYSKAAQSPDFDFAKFYSGFYNQFTPENDTLLKDAVDKLENPNVWKQHSYKKQSIINAFALTYAEMDVFKGGFGVYDHDDKIELNNVCFNSTEFSFGLPFRFQNHGIFGNSPLRNEHSDDLKFDVQLGDIVASSSCFPLGFEPLIFPDDYFSDHNSEAYKALKSETYFKEGIGIMDGGIADNQGIESMINITKRKGMKDRFNLLIVNDVASYKMVPWAPDNDPVRNKKSLRTTLKSILSYFKVKWFYWLILVIGIALLFLNGQGMFGEGQITALYIVGGLLTGIGVVLVILGTILASVKNSASNWITNLIKKNVPEVLLNDVLSFQNLEVGLVKRMLTERLTSGAKMINDVFLKQIRRLNYDMLYNEESLDDKRITSTVYQLNGEKTPYGNSALNKKIQPKPSKSLTHTALIASQTPTTLWWDEEDIKVNRMDSLIACGHFTTCYNLLDYVIDLQKKGYESEELTALRTALTADWEALNKDPMAWVKP